MRAIEELPLLAEAMRTNLARLREVLSRGELAEERRDFGAQVLTLLRLVKDEATPEQKIALFDALADHLVSGQAAAIESAMRGDGAEHADDFARVSHGIAMEGVFGAVGVKALRMTEHLMDGGNGDIG